MTCVYSVYKRDHFLKFHVFLVTATKSSLQIQERTLFIKEEDREEGKSVSCRNSTLSFPFCHFNFKHELSSKRTESDERLDVDVIVSP
jgi:hypothetical protein